MKSFARNAAIRSIRKTKDRDYIEQAFYTAGAMSLTPDGNGYTFTLPSYTDGFTSHLYGIESYPIYRISYTVPNLIFYASAFEPNDEGGYTAHVSTDIGMGIAINEVFTQLDGNWENWEGWDPGANYTLNQISFDLYTDDADWYFAFVGNSDLILVDYHGRKLKLNVHNMDDSESDYFFEYSETDEYGRIINEIKR